MAGIAPEEASDEDEFDDDDNSDDDDDWEQPDYGTSDELAATKATGRAAKVGGKGGGNDGRGGGARTWQLCQTMKRSGAAGAVRQFVPDRWGR